jgi:hypothetical protein
MPAAELPAILRSKADCMRDFEHCQASCFYGVKRQPGTLEQTATTTYFLYTQGKSVHAEAISRRTASIGGEIANPAKGFP